MGIANISIVGNVVRAPSQTRFETGNLVTVIQVAVNRPAKKGMDQETEFYKVEAWNKLGEMAASYIGKGQQVTVIGKFTIERWQDKEGRDRFTPVVTAQQLSLPQKRSNVARNDMTDYSILSAEPTEMVQNAPAETEPALAVSGTPTSVRAS